MQHSAKELFKKKRQDGGGGMYSFDFLFLNAVKYNQLSIIINCCKLFSSISFTLYLSIFLLSKLRKEE